MTDENSPTRPELTLAYVLQSFPLLTETFIYREVLGLRERGLGVATYAVWEPDRDRLSEEARHLVDSSRYVFPISWARFLRAHLFVLGIRPGTYVGTLFLVLTRKGESLKNRWRTLLHFCEAVHLAMAMKDREIRHIHTHYCINASTIALVISRLLDIPFSFTVHNILFTDRTILKEKVRAADFIVTISEYSRQFLTHLVADEDIDDKTYIVHCGISPDAFAPPDPRPVNDVPFLLFVAQMHERKGAPVLVEACRILTERGIRYQCVLVGDGPQKPGVEQLVKQYGLQEAVELPGRLFQEDVKAYLHRADVFVLPCVTASNGDMDGVPVSLMEAMAMEIAAVSTYVSGIPELIEDGRSGLLVPERDARALADALQRLLEDDELRLRLGENGRRKVLSEFNIEKSTDRLAALFEKSGRAQD